MAEKYIGITDIGIDIDFRYRVYNVRLGLVCEVAERRLVPKLLFPVILPLRYQQVGLLNYHSCLPDKFFMIVLVQAESMLNVCVTIVPNLFLAFLGLR